MSKKSLSVIIPTHNRKDILKTNLEKLAEQSYPIENFEVVVIDGGSTDGTPELMASLQGKFPYVLKSLRQGDLGPGSNRNLGLRHATGDIVLIINDDVLPTPTLLQSHMDFHERYSEENMAVLGCVLQAPELKTTPFMKFFVPFSYHLIEGKKEVDYCFFWTCNISLKRKFLMEKGLFNDSVAYPAHEDLELGYRLEQKGLRIFYNKAALGYHHHFQTFEGECEHQRMMGYYLYFLMENVKDWKVYETFYPIIYWGAPAHIIIKKLPRHIIRCTLFNGLTVPYFFKPLVQYLESNPRLAFLAPLLYWKVLSYYTRKGIAQGLKFRSRS